MKQFKLTFACLATGLAFILGGNVWAEGVDVFGYLQCNYMHQFDLASHIKANSGSFNMQEMDLFVHKDLTPTASCLIDLQTLDNFSQEKNWGSINLDEAWIKFSPSKLFNLKVGKIVPIFNNFNEIKSKFPLIPYIVRPIVYESSYQAALQIDQWLPTHAAIQINGTAPVSEAKIDYAVFGGNSDFILSQTQGISSFVPGMDTSKFKMAGGRVGARYSRIKLGVSGTYDYSSHEDVGQIVGNINAALPAGVPGLPALGATPRGRLGLDLSYTGAGLTLESEYIYVKEMMDNANKATLDAVCAAIPQYTGKSYLSNDLTKTFYYVNAAYDFLEKYIVSLGYNRLTDKCNQDLFSNGIDFVMAGVGFRYSDNITIKAQTVYFSNLHGMEIETVNKLATSIGVSAAF